jgi:ADP-ribosylglycohydrolase
MYKRRKTMKDYLISVVVGDMCGAPYEFEKWKAKGEDYIDLNNKYQRFTDDSVCTFAVASWLLNDKEPDLSTTLRILCNLVPGAGYGGMFRKWLADEKMGPYGSFGNGSAMRVSAVSLVAKNEDEVMKLAEESCLPTHNHKDAIIGAQVTALLGWRLLRGAGKEVAKELLELYYPSWTMGYKELQKNYCFRPSAQETVPAALIAFLESSDFEDNLLKNIALCGDADTLCAISAPWAYAYYKEMPEYLVQRAKGMLPSWMTSINDKMNEVYEK